MLIQCFNILLVVATLAVAPQVEQVEQVAAVIPSQSEVLEATRKVSPQLNRTESQHYVLLSDAPIDNAQAVTELLEATLKSFYTTCELIGLQATQPKHKLVAVLFREKSDFTAFAKTQDNMQQTWAAGYYSPRMDRLVMYDGMSNESVKQAMTQLKSNEQRIAKQARAAGAGALDGGGVGGQAATLQQHIQQQKQQVTNAATDNFVSTVTHEAAHQLFFHTGVQKRGVAYPLWLAEGLATGFEAEDVTATNLGFFNDNQKRRNAMRDAVQGDRLIPLRVLVSKDRYTSGGNNQDGELKDFYGQSCIFTMWLARARPTELRMYLDALKNGAYALPTKREEMFENIFGPIDALERVWLRAEARTWAGLKDSAWGKRLAEFEVEMAKNKAAVKEVSTPVSTPALTPTSTPTSTPTLPPTSTPPKNPPAAPGV